MPGQPPACSSLSACSQPAAATACTPRPSPQVFFACMCTVLSLNLLKSAAQAILGSGHFGWFDQEVAFEVGSRGQGQLGFRVKGSAGVQGQPGSGIQGQLLYRVQVSWDPGFSVGVSRVQGQLQAQAQVVGCRMGFRVQGAAAGQGSGVGVQLRVVGVRIGFRVKAGG